MAAIQASIPMQSVAQPIDWKSPAALFTGSPSMIFINRPKRTKRQKITAPFLPEEPPAIVLP
jgi:hypothetical protein